MKIPNPVTAVKELARAAEEWIEGNPVLLSQEAYDARLKVCESCDRYDNGQCLECTCFVKLAANLSTKKCPLNRWPE